MTRMSQTVGILGGMGPEATAVFFREVIRRTPASIDQEHLRIIVVNDPTIPDRTKHLLDGGESPLPALLRAARTLENCGAGLIAIPCNTAHAYFSEIIAAVQVPVLHIVAETVRELERQLDSGGGPVGILSTRATLKLDLYQRELLERGFDPVVPPVEIQELISESITILKSQAGWDGASSKLTSAAGFFEEAGCRALVLGCTELGLAPWQSQLPRLDSLEILAEATVRKALAGSGQAAGKGP